MTEQREYQIPTEQLASAFNFVTKVLWFFIAFAIAFALGDALWSGLPLPGVAVPFFPPEATPGGVAFSWLYVMWRFQGGSVKVRHDSVVVTWPWGSDKK